jgi:hypothetical protein
MKVAPQALVNRRILPSNILQPPAWIGLASVLAHTDEQGIHIEEHVQVPCKCLDSVGAETEQGGILTQRRGGH